MVKARYLAAGLVIGVLISAVGLGRAHRLSGHPQSLRGKLTLAKAQVRHDRAEGSSWLRRDVAYARRLERAMRARSLGPLWLVRAFLCIHHGEGSWTANTGNGFYGGLQMDYGFMRAYGGALLRTKGTADHWTPQEQIGVAIRAYRSRGFYPWPNTARACGLL